jgi:hypothetical protein
MYFSNCQFHEGILEAGMEANKIGRLERKSPNIRSTFSKFTYIEKNEIK